MSFHLFLVLWIAAEKIDQVIAWTDRTFKGMSYTKYHGR